MTPSNSSSFATRDAVNFWAHVGKAYPTPSVCKSSSRILMSLFSHARAYISLKIGDIRQLENITEVKVSLYRKDSITALRLSFNNEAGDPFFSMLPFNASLDSVVSPVFPKNGQQMEIEIHFIDYLNNNILQKVIRVKVDSLKFSDELVKDYSGQLRAEIPKDVIELDAKTLCTTPFHLLDKYFVVDSSATIIKQDSEENEPLFNEGIESPYNALTAV
ncbi:hypothetical protein [Vibrio sp. TRT 29B02]|uniref:hypothetical protein n=1 Tax=Vibrio sp. TRT 29B02 TaxID=3418508 RepID=UPI003CE9D990